MSYNFFSVDRVTPLMWWRILHAPWLSFPHGVFIKLQTRTITEQLDFTYIYMFKQLS